MVRIRAVIGGASSTLKAEQAQLLLRESTLDTGPENSSQCIAISFSKHLVGQCRIIPLAPIHASDAARDEVPSTTRPHESRLEFFIHPPTLHILYIHNTILLPTQPAIHKHRTHMTHPNAGMGLKATTTE